MRSTSVLKGVLVTALAGAVALGSMAPASARPYRHHHRNNAAAASIFALGALGIGLAIANNHRHRDYYYDDRYAYDPGPGIGAYEGRYRDRRYYERRGFYDRGARFDRGPRFGQPGHGFRGSGIPHRPINRALGADH